ncbi:MAG: replication associated protein [Cressdnaviricota sp.]|nr:MAG: replication associated protein [Cressdnaviricota sp.]
MPKRGSVDHDGSAGRQGGKKPREAVKSSFHIRLTASKVLSEETLAQWISGSVDQPDEPDLVLVLKNFFAGGRVSLEKGEGGVPHFQCTTLCGKDRKRRSAVRTFLEDNYDDLLFPQCDYCEPCEKTWAALEYVQKEDTHVAGPWEWGLNSLASRDLKPGDLPEPRLWQKDLLKRYEDEPPAGSSVVQWYYDPEGQVGKTTCAKMLVMTKKWYLLDGSAQKMKFQAAKNPKMGYIINLSRIKEDRFSYEGLEALSDNFYCDTFGSDQKGMIMRKPSWVVVFANWRPDGGSMSKGRIKTFEWCEVAQNFN